jgi:hypothetical protein
MSRPGDAPRWGGGGGGRGAAHGTRPVLGPVCRPAAGRAAPQEPSATAALPPEKQNKNPRRVLQKAYASVAGICALVGALGYALFGSGAAEVVTANLVGTPVGVGCLLLTAVAPFAAFALTLEPVALALQRALAASGGSGGDGSSGAQPPYAVRAAVRLGALAPARGRPRPPCLPAAAGPRCAMPAPSQPTAPSPPPSPVPHPLIPPLPLPPPSGRPGLCLRRRRRGAALRD